MNEQSNVEKIRETYAAFAAGDVQAIMAGIEDDAPWINYGPETIPYAGSRAGKAQILQFFQAIGESTTGGRIVAERFVAQGDTVVATGRYQATVKATGVKIDSPVAHVFTLKNGKIARWEGYSDSAMVAAAHAGTAAAGR